MTTRTDRFTRHEKVALTLLALAFGFTETHSMSQYRKLYERDQTKVEQAARFQNATEVLQNIPGQFQSNLVAGEMCAKTTPDSNKGMAEAYKQTPSVAERGVAFPYFLGRRIDTASGSAERWQLVVMNPGNTPLFDVTARIGRRTTPQGTFLDMSTKSDSIIKIAAIQPAIYGPSGTSCFLPPGSYSIDIATRGDRFEELLDIQADPSAPGGFSEHYRIYRLGSTELLFADGNLVNTVLQ